MATLPLPNRASRVVAELSQRPDTDAILLSGSYAKGTAHPASDIDIIVISDIQGPLLREYEGVPRIDIQRYAMNWLEPPPSAAVDLRVLREAGRLASARILFTTSNGLEGLKDRARSLVLEPGIGRSILSTARDNLARLDCSTLSPELRLSSVHGACFALVIVALSTTPTRYQKPKWIMHDLYEVGWSDLARTIRHAVLGAPPHEQTAISLVSLIRRRLLQACRQLSLPPLSRGVGHGFKYEAIRSAYVDANRLIEVGDYSGSVVSAIHSLRFAATALQHKGHAWRPNQDVQSWFFKSYADLQLVGPQWSLDDLKQSLREVEAAYEHQLAQSARIRSGSCREQTGWRCQTLDS